MVDTKDTKKEVEKPKAKEKVEPIQTLPDLAAWIRHVTKLGGGLDGAQTQQVLSVLDSYGGEPTKREATKVELTVPPGPPPAPPTIGPGT